MPKKPSDFSGAGVSDEERNNLSDESKKILDRAAMGTPPSGPETQKMADEIRNMRGRPMFDSPSLEKELYRIKNGK